MVVRLMLEVLTTPAYIISYQKRFCLVMLVASLKAVPHRVLLCVGGCGCCPLSCPRQSQWQWALRQQQAQLTNCPHHHFIRPCHQLPERRASRPSVKPGGHTWPCLAVACLLRGEAQEWVSLLARSSLALCQEPRFGVGWLLEAYLLPAPSKCAVLSLKFINVWVWWS